MKEELLNKLYEYEESLKKLGRYLWLRRKK